jgi:hypothetical protein
LAEFDRARPSRLPISEESNPFRTRIQAGDRVDVLTSVTEGSAIVAENLMVLAVGGSTATGGSPNLLHDAGVSLSTTPMKPRSFWRQSARAGGLVLRHQRDLTLGPQDRGPLTSEARSPTELPWRLSMYAERRLRIGFFLLVGLTFRAHASEPSAGMAPGEQRSHVEDASEGRVEQKVFSARDVRSYSEGTRGVVDVADLPIREAFVWSAGGSGNDRTIPL